MMCVAVNGAIFAPSATDTECLGLIEVIVMALNLFYTTIRAVGAGIKFVPFTTY
jgi:hypothetical protein